MASKKRIDILLHEQGFAPSREKAQAMIMAGEVLVNGLRIDKPGTKVTITAEISVRSKPRFVSRGGEKLAGALKAFKVDPTGRICADVGASTGGFTDCLLQNGAARVYAIDVGYGQLDYTLRRDKRVVVIERTNARYLEHLPEFVNLVTLDASFISLKLLLPTIQGWLTSHADIIPLIKPQFEAGRDDVGKGGVIKDSAVHIRVLQEILTFAHHQGFNVRGLITSPIKGPAGNTEFLAWLSYGEASSASLNVDDLIHAIVN